MAMMTLKNIQFSYPQNNQPVLAIDEFTVNPGEKLFIYGPSGCGKSTFLEIIAGILKVSQGSYQFLDQLVSSASQMDRIRSTHMGYIFQSFNLIPYLSVKENIVLPLYLSTEKRQRTPEKEESTLVQTLCEKLNIASFLNKPVSELSVGQQQRVAAARALIGKPDLILADEPTSALDHDHREKFIRVFFESCELNNTAVLFVSHDRTLGHLFDRSISLPEINKVSYDVL